MLDLSTGYVASPPHRVDPLARLRRYLHDIDPNLPKDYPTFASAPISLAGCAEPVAVLPNLFPDAEWLR